MQQKRGKSKKRSISQKKSKIRKNIKSNKKIRQKKTIKIQKKPNKKRIIKKTIKLNKKPIQKKVDKKTTPKKIKQKKITKKHISTKIKLFLSFLIIGGTFSYIFQHIYIYIPTIASLLLTIIFLKKKQKTQKISQNKKTYTTEFDRLYDLVKINKTIKISAISKIFKIRKKEAEDWARILEEHELIDLHYPLLGEPELKWKQ